MVSILSQTSLSQISMHKKYIYSCENIFFFQREFSNHLKNLILIKRSKREIKDSQYSEAAFESLIVTWSFLLKFLKHTCERVYFWRQLFLTFLESLELTVTN